MGEKELKEEVNKRISALSGKIQKKVNKFIHDTKNNKSADITSEMEKAENHLKELKVYKDFFSGMQKGDFAEYILFDLAARNFELMRREKLKPEAVGESEEDYKNLNQKLDEYATILTEGLINRALTANLPDKKETLDEEFRRIAKAQATKKGDIEAFLKEKGLLSYNGLVIRYYPKKFSVFSKELVSGKS